MGPCRKTVYAAMPVLLTLTLERSLSQKVQV
jgi:hypothetical protein